MSDLLLGGLIPTRWMPPSWPTKYDQVIVVDWLQREVDPSAPARMPILNELKGWRNREVWEFVSGPNSYDWTARMYR